MKVRTVVLVLAAALALAGCSKEIEGTPMADPAAPDAGRTAADRAGRHHVR